MTKIYTFSQQHLLPLSKEEAWNFFSSPLNLQKITPPEMDFQIVSSHLPDQIHNGLKILYMVKPILGLQLNWESEITDVEQWKCFTDKQLKGPFKLWEHKHIFVERSNGILMEDQLRYALPLGFLGQIAHQLIVMKKIEDIFQHREKTLNQILFGI